LAWRLGFRYGEGKNFLGLRQEKEARESLPGDGGKPLFKAEGEEAESCGELARPSRLRVSFRNGVADSLAQARGGPLCQWNKSRCGCCGWRCAASPRHGRSYRLTACGSRLQAEPGLSIPAAHETCMRAHGAEPT
jgi:hypothetical protein